MQSFETKLRKEFAMTVEDIVFSMMAALKQESIREGLTETAIIL